MTLYTPNELSAVQHYTWLQFIDTWWLGPTVAHLDPTEGFLS